ncbi:HNH endonuclease [Paraburkholderia acidicola]|uniref:HNH endonuclease n=1 Tax=Paraburkholderia acidicola TaxID=1912599 RepID=UPI002E25ECF4
MHARTVNRCANPDCGAVTSGQTDDPYSAVNVGEAAHIYGAHPGSARYDPRMTSDERSAISNAIWLCSNCHKLVLACAGSALWHRPLRRRSRRVIS